MSMSLRK